MSGSRRSRKNIAVTTGSEGTMEQGERSEGRSRERHSERQGDHGASARAKAIK
jgi:hypothetical protein